MSYTNPEDPKKPPVSTLLQLYRFKDTGGSRDTHAHTKTDTRTSHYYQYTVQFSTLRVQSL